MNKELVEKVRQNLKSVGLDMNQCDSNITLEEAVEGTVEFLKKNGETVEAPGVTTIVESVMFGSDDYFNSLLDHDEGGN